MRKKREIFSHTNQDGLSAINLTSLMDLMCVLLIIFIIATPTLFSNISVNLPKVQSNPVETNSNFQYIDITITKDKKIYVNNSISTKTKLIDSIKSFIDKKETMIFIKADEECLYKDVTEIMSILNSNGYNSISLLGKI